MKKLFKRTSRYGGSPPFIVSKSSNLSQGFVENDGHGVAQIKTPGVVPHGDREADFFVGGDEGLRKAPRFISKDQVILRLKLSSRVGHCGLGAAKPATFILSVGPE